MPKAPSVTSGTDGDRDVCRIDDAEPDPFGTFGTDKGKRFRPIECAKHETAAIRPKGYSDEAIGQQLSYLD